MTALTALTDMMVNFTSFTSGTLVNITIEYNLTQLYKQATTLYINNTLERKESQPHCLISTIDVFYSILF